MRPTCDDNLAHSTILFSNPTTEQLVQRSVGAWPFSNTLLPIQRVGLGRELFFTVVTLVPLRMVMLLRDVHYDHLEIGNGHRQRGCSDMEAGNTGQILTEAGPSVHGVCCSTVNCHLDLGATPSVQTTVHQIGTFLNSPFHSTFYTHCTAGRCCPYCASWPAELCYTSGLAIRRHIGWVITAQLPGGHRWCHIEVPAGWPSESTQYPGLLRVLEPSQRGAPLRVPLPSLCCGSCHPGCPWRQSHTCTR